MFVETQDFQKNYEYDTRHPFAILFVLSQLAVFILACARGKTTPPHLALDLRRSNQAVLSLQVTKLPVAPPARK